MSLRLRFDVGDQPAAVAGQVLHQELVDILGGSIQAIELDFGETEALTVVTNRDLDAAELAMVTAVVTQHGGDDRVRPADGTTPGELRWFASVGAAAIWDGAEWRRVQLGRPIRE